MKKYSKTKKKIRQNSKKSKTYYKFKTFNNKEYDIYSLDDFFYPNYKTNSDRFNKLKKSKEIQPYYKSKTSIKNGTEIYSLDDIFYPNFQTNLNRINKLKKLLKYGHEFFKKYKINYSISYGTLLGYYRNRKIIPYDNDCDCFIGLESFNKLINLANDKNKPNIMFQNDISNKLDFSNNKIYILLNKSLLTNKGYHHTVHNCNGGQNLFLTNACSFKKFIGRFLIDEYVFYDIFVLNKNYFKKKTNNYPKYYKDMANLNHDDLQISKLESITISVFKDKLIEKILKKEYGNNFLIPNLNINNRITNLYYYLMGKS